MLEENLYNTQDSGQPETNETTTAEILEKLDQAQGKMTRMLAHQQKEVDQKQGVLTTNLVTLTTRLQEKARTFASKNPGVYNPAEAFLAPLADIHQFVTRINADTADFSASSTIAKSIESTGNAILAYVELYDLFRYHADFIDTNVEQSLSIQYLLAEPWQKTMKYELLYADALKHIENYLETAQPLLATLTQRLTTENSADLHTLQQKHTAAVEEALAKKAHVTQQKEAVSTRMKSINEFLRSPLNRLAAAVQAERSPGKLDGFISDIVTYLYDQNKTGDVAKYAEQYAKAINNPGGDLTQTMAQCTTILKIISAMRADRRYEAVDKNTQGLLDSHYTVLLQAINAYTDSTYTPVIDQIQAALSALAEGQDANLSPQDPILRAFYTASADVDRYISALDGEQTDPDLQALLTRTRERSQQIIELFSFSGSRQAHLIKTIRYLTLHRDTDVKHRLKQEIAAGIASSYTPEKAKQELLEEVRLLEQVPLTGALHDNLSHLAAMLAAMRMLDRQDKQEAKGKWLGAMAQGTQDSNINRLAATIDKYLRTLQTGVTTTSPLATIQADINTLVDLDKLSQCAKHIFEAKSHKTFAQFFENMQQIRANALVQLAAKIAGLSPATLELTAGKPLNAIVQMLMPIAGTEPMQSALLQHRIALGKRIAAINTPLNAAITALEAIEGTETTQAALKQIRAELPNTPTAELRQRLQTLMVALHNSDSTAHVAAQLMQVFSNLSVQSINLGNNTNGFFGRRSTVDPGIDNNNNKNATGTNPRKSSEENTHLSLTK